MTGNSAPQEIENKVLEYVDRLEAVTTRAGKRISPGSIAFPDDVRDQIQSLQDAIGRGDGGGGGTGPILRDIWAGIRRDLTDYWTNEWTRRRRLGIERHKEDIINRLAEPPNLPDWLRLLPAGILTARQNEALVLRFGYGLSLAEAATCAGIAKTPMQKHVSAAQKKVERFWGMAEPEGEGFDWIFEAALKLAYRLRQWDRLWGETRPDQLDDFSWIGVDPSRVEWEYEPGVRDSN